MKHNTTPVTANVAVADVLSCRIGLYRPSTFTTPYMVSVDIQCAFYEQLQLLVAIYMTEMLILALAIRLIFVLGLGFKVLALTYNILALT